MILRILTLTLASYSLCFSQEAQKGDTLNTVHVNESSLLVNVLNSAYYNSSEIFKSRTDTPVFYTVIRTLYYQDRKVAEYHADIFLTKKMFSPRVIRDSIVFFEQVEQTDPPNFNAAFHNIAIKNYRKKIRLRKTKLPNSKIWINDTNGVILKYTFNSVLNDSTNSILLEFIGTTTNNLALSSYSWAGVMPNTSRANKEKTWSSSGSNTFDPKTQIILSHKNTLKIYHFREDVNIQIKKNPSVLDENEKFKTLSFLDLYSLSKQLEN